MKRQKFIKHLNNHNCTLDRNGGKHDIYINNDTGEWSTVPRHRTLRKFTAFSICKQLGIPKP